MGWGGVRVWRAELRLAGECDARGKRTEGKADGWVDLYSEESVGGETIDHRVESAIQHFDECS